jgi:tyrosyl-tRNA synthetase
LLDLLAEIGAFPSKGEARRMIQNGGVRIRFKVESDFNINDKVFRNDPPANSIPLDDQWFEWKVDDPQAFVKFEKSSFVVQIGKRKFYKVNF